MATLFISDLHLDASLPILGRLFDKFITGQATQSDAVYILGDLFEVWVGDDDDRPETEQFVAMLCSLTTSGVPVYVMQGNRDFLLGSQFVARSGCHLLEEPVVIDLYGEPTLLLHGDSLCTDDVKHMQSRAMYKSSAWQEDFLARSLAERIELAKQYRQMSREHLHDQPEAIIDVNADAVARIMHEYNVRQLIHGHTHRPAIHKFNLDGQPAKRIVLGDWGDTGSLLTCDENACELTSFDLQ